MKLKKYLITSILVLCLPFVGCTNVFSSLARKDTDEALFEDAEKLMDEQDWDGALSKFALMSPSFQTQTEVIEAWASVHAGKCGLDFIEYFTNLGEADLTGSTIFKYLMNAWTGTAVSVADCTLAQTKMEEISANPGERTSEQNLFMAILGMVKMGVYLRSYLDGAVAGDLGDGTADPEIDICLDDDGDDAVVGEFPNAGLDEFITGFGLLTSNLVYLTAVLSGSVEDGLSAVNAVCADPDIPPGTCGKTDPTTIVDADRFVFRNLLRTAATHPTVAMGVGDCVVDDPMIGFLACCPP